jgi:nucleotide-binding universal stress UspA family protein
MAKHILVPYDFSGPSNRALEMAHHLRSRLHAAVDVVHVFLDPFSELEHPPKESIWASSEQMDAHLEAVRGQVRAAVADVFGPDAQAVTSHAVRGRPAQEVLRVAEEVGADLLVVGATGKGGVERALLGSVSAHLIRKSPIPVLTVK